MALKMALLRLRFEGVSFLLGQLIEPFWLDKLVDLPSELVRELIFEQIEVLIFKNLVSWRSSIWPEALQLFDLVLKRLDNILVILTQVAHIVWITVDDDLIVLSHQGRGSNRTCQQIWMLLASNVLRVCRTVLMPFIKLLLQVVSSAPVVFVELVHILPPALLILTLVLVPLLKVTSIWEFLRSMNSIFLVWLWSILSFKHLSKIDCFIFMRRSF